jgi:hypothetical protein
LAVFVFGLGKQDENPKGFDTIVGKNEQREVRALRVEGDPTLQMLGMCNPCGPTKN